MKILLLDDEKLIIRALYLGLQKASHQAIETYHPLEALKRIGEEKFDLLILDYHLSLLSGIDILKILRINNEIIPTLILSSQKFTEKEIAGFELRRDQILSKDRPIAEILREIDNYIQSYIIPKNRR